jgi:hypothetical protein
MRRAHQQEKSALFRKYRADAKALGALHREEARLYCEKHPFTQGENFIRRTPLTINGVEYPSKKAALIALGFPISDKERRRKRKSEQVQKGPDAP